MTTANFNLADGVADAWWSGNARLVNYSGQLLGAHLAHAGLIMFWAGSCAIADAVSYTPSLPIGEQTLWVIPHLANLGFGFEVDGTLNTYPYFVIGVLHLVASAVLAAGGLFHVFGGPADLADASGTAEKFHYEWRDHQQLGLILGHHLLFLGIAAWLFVLKARFWGGIYDPNLGLVHTITSPTLSPTTIFGYVVGLNHGAWDPHGLASVRSLEDVVGGHAWIGLVEILGGIWHIFYPPSPWARYLLKIEADAVLSYSLAGIAWMAFLSCFFVYNPLVFPPELFGADVTVSANTQFFLGIVALGGHIWHASLARAKWRAKFRTSPAN